MKTVKASSENIRRDLEMINTFNSTPEEGTTRILFTEEEVKSREYVKSRMKELGFSVREDAIGNIFGTLEGSDPALPPVWTGSHIDTVYNAGMFDGMSGVVCGMEALRLIKERGLPRKRNLEVIVFTSEEPTRFGIGCLGSRALAGALTLSDAQRLKDEDGSSLAEVLTGLGYDLEQFGDIPRKKGDVHASVELHIEQGEVLESMGLKVGLVTVISAPTVLDLRIRGTQEHAGATPMNIRRDAMAAAAEIVLEAEKAARAEGDSSTVATVGKLQVHPGASNVISGLVELTIDIRSSDSKKKDRVAGSIRAFTEYLAVSRGVEITVETVCDDQPAVADPHIVETLEAVCREYGLPYNKMYSGAFHDSMLVSQFAPYSMIFVPSRGGISHHKDEWTDFEDLALGTDLLAEVLYRFSNED